jgi:hypothetical protein
MRYYGIVLNLFAMKRILVIVFLISSSFLTQAKDSYEDYFQDEQEDVAQFLRVYEPKLQQKSHKYCHQNNFVTAIIYPELLRYNYVQDFIETAGLELIYIRYGSKTVDFSIGHFQMKPSFAEQIEKYIEKYPIEFSKYKKLIFTRKSTSLFQRKIRLVRLKQIDWQLNYIHAFIAICDHKFHFLKFTTSKDKLRFYAACYNIGFHKKYQNILQNENLNTFPNGSKYLGTQFCYASIASAYYQKTKSL